METECWPGWKDKTRAVPEACSWLLARTKTKAPASTARVAPMAMTTRSNRPWEIGPGVLGGASR
jgi:hypothetical protein